MEAAAANGGLLIVALSAAMCCGALLPGILAISVSSASPLRLRTVSLLGSGILIGTALLVVLPEGIHMWYALAEESHAGGQHHEGEESEDWLIGFSLTLGFVFMILVDRLGGSHGHGHSHSASPLEGDAEKGVPETRVEDVKSWSATFGLAVHAAVDGVALGAATVTNNSSLSMIVFMAIMMHKGPAAFGLASFLLSLGVSKANVRHTVLWFSCVAPMGALVTYFLLSLSGTLSGAWVALLLIFSGGTFLYVSTVHILPEYSAATMKRRDTALFIAGILLPLVPTWLNVGHGHG